ncbi:hypothetical protein [Phreatobacter stygius]|uniref:NarX-like N-terminal domain-containing protein n=1 Tax=Phreatobacter stygius TaxID=1940610 RepID=A0A4D7BDY1_9HYPH|nr:hypothetical protein [Phreatobacter stygius]QCI68178.1 hypothetical protein E8M01_30490 [Phreatobacter stygius]
MKVHFRIIVLAILLAAASLGAVDGGLCAKTGSFISKLTEAQSLFRATTTSLRAGRTEEADASLRRLTALWTEATIAYRADPPALFARVNMFPEVLEGAGARLKRASDALSENRAEAALEELLPLRREWIMLRKSAGLYGLVECLDESSDALDAFMVMKRTPPDMTRAEARGDVLAKAAVYRWALRRCDAYAATEVITDAEYRRLADPIVAGLDVVATAVRLRDAALLERILVDLKTFDTQLSQRFGG